jgi:hypothetical protein
MLWLGTFEFLVGLFLVVVACVTVSAAMFVRKRTESDSSPSRSNRRVFGEPEDESQDSADRDQE